MHQYTVTNSLPKGHRKQLTISDGKKSSIFISVPRFACVGKGDQIAIDPSHISNIFCISAEDVADQIRLAPHYEATEKISIGALRIDARVTEINRAEDLESLAFLEQFHYKSIYMDDEEEQGDLLGGARLKSSPVGGRRAVLLLYARLNGEWIAVGYIDLQMPLLMCKPRHDLFSVPFHHRTRPISWTVWDQHAMRRYVNLIVRIARVVVHPDFRGLGLTRILISHAKAFAKSRWHVSGRRPLFMEISAEMLNYVDFVSSSGFVYIDKTEGNASRVVKDLQYMANDYDVTFGMMSLQKKYLTTIQRYSAQTGIPLKEVLTRLQEVLNHPDPADVLSPTEWAAFRRVLRQRIPYYLCPLDDDAANYLKPAGSKVRRQAQSFRVASTTIDLRSISVKSSFTVPQTRNVRIILDAFGLAGGTAEAMVVPPMGLKASSGNIVLVVGVSGSGKSAFLRALDPNTDSSGSLITRVDGTRSYVAGWLKTLPPDIPVFDFFATRYSPERAFAALSQVGLSEAFALIKPFKILSRGQQYRAMLADLLLREEQVWLVDEFCADLDPVTARIVAHNFRRYVMATGRIAFVAAANHGHYLDALRPTKVIKLKLGASAKVINFGEYKDELFQQVV